MEPGQTILVVGDESRERDALVSLLQAEGYQVLTASTTEAALDAARKMKPAVALIDLWLADLPGHVVLHGVRHASPETECIALLTSSAQQEGAREALQLGAFTFLRRSFDTRQLLGTVQRAIEKRENARALEDMKQRLAVLFDTLPVGVLIVDDRTGAVVDANPAAVTFMGAPKAEIVGAILQSRALATPNAARGADPAPADEQERAAPSAENTPDAATTLRQTGRRIPATRTVASIMIGARRHRVECFVDVSGRLEVEDQLAAASTLNRALLEEVKDLVFSADRQGRVLRVFQAPSREVEAAATEGQAASAEFIPAGGRDRYRQLLNTVFHSGRGLAFSAGNPPFESWSVRIDPVQCRGETLAVVVRVRDLSALEQLTQRQRFRDSVVTHGAEAVMVVNTEGMIVDANTATARLLGYEGVDLVGMSFQQVDHPEQPRPWAQLWAAAAAQGRVTYTSRQRTRGGARLPVRQVLVHVVHSGVALVLVYLEDQASAEHAASALADVAARERSLLDATDDPAWVVDRAGHARSLNAAAARLTKRPVADVVGLPFAQLLSGELAQSRRQRVEDTFIRGGVVTFEDHADGHRHAIRMSPVRDHGGAFVSVVVVARDITDSRGREAKFTRLWEHAQEALLDLDLGNVLPLAPAGAQEAELDAYLQGAPERVVAILAAVAVKFVNPQAVIFFRQPAAKLIQHGLAPLVPKESARAVADALLRLAAGRSEVITLTQTLAAADTVVHAVVRLAVRPDADGRPRFASLGILDRSAHVAAQLEVLDTSAREQARVGMEIATLLASPLQAAAASMERLRETLSAREPALAGDAATLAGQLAALQAQVATLTQGLAGGVAPDMGLMAVLGSLADAATTRWGVTCRCNVRTAGLSADRTLARHLHGIAREAVGEAVQRRGARQLSITVTASPREALLTIKDDGTAPATDADTEQLAQRLIHSHALLIHGVISHTRDGRGTNTLTCRFRNG
ncbi:MAG: PAS domain-containing protein [Verrucomicrobia bacterium]|nr:PAS domain-containing protein [Verrucomicrobiota bacterium]